MYYEVKDRIFSTNDRLRVLLKYHRKLSAGDRKHSIKIVYSWPKSFILVMILLSRTIVYFPLLYTFYDRKLSHTILLKIICDDKTIFGSLQNLMFHFEIKIRVRSKILSR